MSTTVYPKPTGTGLNGQHAVIIQTKVDIKESDIQGITSGERDAVFHWWRGTSGYTDCGLEVVLDGTGNSCIVKLDSAKATIVDNGNQTIRIQGKVKDVNATVPVGFAVGDSLDIIVDPLDSMPLFGSFTFRNFTKSTFLRGNCSGLTVIRRLWK